MKKFNNANGNNRPDVVNHLANAHGEHHISRSSQQILKEQLLDALITDDPAKEHVPELLKPSPTHPTTTGEVIHDQLFPILDALAGETVPATPESHTLDTTANTAPIASDIDSGLFFNDELSVLLSNPDAHNKQHAQHEKTENQPGLDKSLSISKSIPTSTKSAEITPTPATISTDQVIDAINFDLFASPIFDNNTSVSKKQHAAVSHHSQSQANKTMEESQIGTFASGFFNLELNTFDIDRLNNLRTEDNDHTLTLTSTEKMADLAPFDLTINRNSLSLETFPTQLTAEYGIWDKKIDDQLLLPPLLSSDLVTELLHSHDLPSNAPYHISSWSKIKPLDIDTDFVLFPEITIEESLSSSSLPNTDLFDFSQLSFTPFISFNEGQHLSFLEINFKANNHLPVKPEIMTFISLSTNDSATIPFFDTESANTEPFIFNYSIPDETDLPPPATTSDFSSASALQQGLHHIPSSPVDINLMPLSFDAFTLTHTADAEFTNTQQSVLNHSALDIADLLPPATTGNCLSIAPLDFIIHDMPPSLLALSKLHHLHFAKFQQAFNQPFDQSFILEPISLTSTSLLPTFIHGNLAENNFNLSIKGTITAPNTSQTTENNSKFFTEVLFKDTFDFLPDELFSTSSSVFNTDKSAHETTSSSLLGKGFFDNHLYTDPLVLNAEELAHFPQTPFVSPVLTNHQIQLPNSEAMVHQIISALTQENGHSLPTDNQNHESTAIEKLLNIKPEIIFTLLKGEITLTGIHIPSNTDHQLLSKIINNQESLIIFHDFDVINYYTSEHHYLLDYTSPYDQECIQHDIY